MIRIVLLLAVFTILLTPGKSERAHPGEMRRHHRDAHYCAQAGEVLHRNAKGDRQ